MNTVNRKTIICVSIVALLVAGSAGFAAAAERTPLEEKLKRAFDWSLDMTYREDDSRVRQRTFTENLAWLRRFTLSLIKQHPGKESNIMKRRMAAWSVDFLMQVLTGQNT